MKLYENDNKEKLLKEIKYFLYKQTVRSEVLMNDIINCNNVGEIMIFRKKDIIELVDIIRGVNKNE